MKSLLVLGLAADGIPVSVACRVLGFSKQAYYVWRAAPVAERDWSDAHLINAAIDVHRDEPACRYRFIADELEDQGFSAGENRVGRLCSTQQIWSLFGKKRGRTRKGGRPCTMTTSGGTSPRRRLISCGLRTSPSTGPLDSSNRRNTLSIRVCDGRAT
jgi:hypothetical protein